MCAGGGVCLFHEQSGRLLLRYDARSCTFHRFKVPKRPMCAACGDSPTIDSMRASSQFCATKNLRGVASGGCAAPKASAAPAAAETQVGACDDGAVSVEEYLALRKSGKPHLLVDVRDRTQFGMCSLAGALNIPVRRAPCFTHTPFSLKARHSASLACDVGALLFFFACFRSPDLTFFYIFCDVFAITAPLNCAAGGARGPGERGGGGYAGRLVHLRHLSKGLLIAGRCCDTSEILSSRG